MSLSKTTRSGMRGRWQPGGWDVCRVGKRAANWAQSGSRTDAGRAGTAGSCAGPCWAHLVGSECAPPGQDEEQRGDHQIQSRPGQGELPGAAGGLVAVDALDAVGGKAAVERLPGGARAEPVDRLGRQVTAGPVAVAT